MNLKIAIVILIMAMTMNQRALAEDRKVAAKELEALIGLRYMSTGITDHGWAFLLINQPGGAREVYVNNFHGMSSTRKERAMVKGDQLCAVREVTNEERCFDIYHMGDNRYESRANGLRYTTWHVFRPD
jgi:hypothetical protein